ncbi:MAG: dephospho-CoA kinase [Bdellovibrionales bacterium]|nr:dephospho-CoA kinase [Bdellovibrionales bacterium]
MKWIGITGSMGSGKSTVSEILRRRGLKVLDADQVVRTVLSPGGEAETEVYKTFGEGVRGVDGTLDRRKLGVVVFGNPAKLEQLEWIIHPRVRAEVASQRAALEAAGEEAAFYDVPLLYEKRMEDQFDAVIVVSASPAVRLQRLQKRTGLTVAEIEERWSHQLPAQLKESRADAVVKNNGSLEDLEREVSSALNHLGIG